MRKFGVVERKVKVDKKTTSMDHLCLDVLYALDA